jgi:hypothetical protein
MLLLKSKRQPMDGDKHSESSSQKAGTVRQPGTPIGRDPLGLSRWPDERGLAEAGFQGASRHRNLSGQRPLVSFHCLVRSDEAQPIARPFRLPHPCHGPLTLHRRNFISTVSLASPLTSGFAVPVVCFRTFVSRPTVAPSLRQHRTYTFASPSPTSLHLTRPFLSALDA